MLYRKPERSCIAPESPNKPTRRATDSPKMKTKFKLHRHSTPVDCLRHDNGHVPSPATVDLKPVLPFLDVRGESGGKKSIQDVSAWCFFGVFDILFLRGDSLSRKLLFRGGGGGPTKSLQIHAHIQICTTQSQTIKSYLYTHTVWSVAALFSSSSGVQGWVWTQNIP